MTSKPPAYFLIVKIGVIGDLIMLLPTIRQPRQDHPDAHISLMVGKGLLPLVELIPEIDELIPVDEKALYRGSPLQKVSTLLRVAARLRWRRVDRVMIGHGDARYRVFARRVRAGRVDSWQSHGGRLFPVPGSLHADEYLRLYHGRDDDSMPVSTPYVLEQRLALPQTMIDRLPALGNADAGQSSIMWSWHTGWSHPAYRSSWREARRICGADHILRPPQCST